MRPGNRLGSARLGTEWPKRPPRQMDARDEDEAGRSRGRGILGVTGYTYLLLGELLAASLLADLVALVVAAGGAFAAVILALAADAFAAAFALLLRRLRERWTRRKRRRRREGEVGGCVVVGRCRCRVLDWVLL